MGLEFGLGLEVGPSNGAGPSSLRGKKALGGFGAGPSRSSKGKEPLVLASVSGPSQNRGSRLVMGKGPFVGSKPIGLGGRNRPSESVWRRCKMSQHPTMGGVVCEGNGTRFPIGSKGLSSMRRGLSHFR